MESFKLINSKSETIVLRKRKTEKLRKNNKNKKKPNELISASNILNIFTVD